MRVRTPSIKDSERKYQKSEKGVKTRKEYRNTPNHKAYMRNYYKKNWLTYTLRQAEKRALQKGIPFNLQPSDIVIPTHCPILGIEIKTDSESKKHSPSLDRIDNTKGYTKDNVAIISNKANRSKSDMTIQQVENLLKYMKKELD